MRPLHVGGVVGAAEPREVPAELLGNQMFKAIGRPRQALVVAADLAARCLHLLDLAEVFFKPSQAIGSHGGGVVDIADLLGCKRLGPTEDGLRLAFFRPDRQPRRPAIGALAQFLPLGDIDCWPAHHGVILDARPIRTLHAQASSGGNLRRRHGG